MRGMAPQLYLDEVLLTHTLVELAELKGSNNNFYKDFSSKSKADRICGLGKVI